MSLLVLFGTAFVIGLSGAMMPGPVLTATVTLSLRHGGWAGPRVVLGHALPELAVMGLVLAGGAAYLARASVLGVLGLVGGGLLVLMGIDIFRSVRKAVAQTEAVLAGEGGADGAASAWRGPLFAGIVLSITNPYWTFWWATIGLRLAGESLQHGIAGLAAFYSGHILSDLAWYSVVSFAIARGRRAFPPRVLRAILVLCGVAMLFLGARFAGDGAGRLF